MRKLYIGLALILVFLAALLIDWNIRQESAQRSHVATKIQSRDDDLMEFEIGYPGGKGPPEGTKPQPRKTTRTAPPKPASTVKTVPSLDEEGPDRQKEGLESIAGYRIYEVKKGDTLSEISQIMLGTSRRTKEIMELNGIRDPKLIQAGSRLKIPMD
jgi:nucleoid-associated protein YgaU